MLIYVGIITSTGDAPETQKPVPSPAQGNPPAGSEQEKTDGTSTDTKNNVGDGSTKAPAFDEKAIQRSFLVLAGLGTILLAYFGIKFAWLDSFIQPFTFLHK